VFIGCSGAVVESLAKSSGFSVGVAFWDSKVGESERVQLAGERIDI
jgi:hypothetical protein